jgi:hypothetical protein
VYDWQKHPFRTPPMRDSITGGERSADLDVEKGVVASVVVMQEPFSMA